MRLMTTGETGRGYELKQLQFEILSDEARGLVDSWAKHKEPKIRTDWHLYFILQAFLVSTRSLDAQTQCGCVLVKNKTVIGTGYNSFIREIKDYVLPNLRPAKYPFMIHSEHNAILNCAKNGISCDGATAYITGPPCCACLQYMYQAGITSMYFTNNNHANMCQNREYEIEFEILANLMENLKIHRLDLDSTTLEKIAKIKSC